MIEMSFFLLAIRQLYLKINLCWILCIVIGCFLCNENSLEIFFKLLFQSKPCFYDFVEKSGKWKITSLIKREYLLLSCLLNHRWINSHWLIKYHAKYQHIKLWNLRYLEFIKKNTVLSTVRGYNTVRDNRILYRLKGFMIDLITRDRIRSPQYIQGMISNYLYLQSFR